MPADYLLVNQPDILEVISNLSNDAVFTPPKVANALLDLLPDGVWTDASLRWLDPGAKTGIFPREITKRLMVGLAEVIPDEEDRLLHILSEMVFAIATEEITGMMTRRSLYCSKDASSAFSVALFASPYGNVWQKRVEHSFSDKGTCTECKGARAELEIAGRDNKAYGFIHADGQKQIDKEMTMKFDVIVGNPPYQMTGGGGGTNDTPLYNIFVDEAMKLDPRYISMIIPSRWMAGGRGLDDFRSRMLSDKRVRHLVDFTQMDSLFPGVDFEGGVCYFLWDRDTPGACQTTFVQGESSIGPSSRRLDEFDIFVRDERALDIIHKALAKKEQSVTEMVSGDTPFGIPTNFTGFRKGPRKTGDLTLHMNQGGKRVEKWIPDDSVRKNRQLIRCWKVFSPKAYGERGAIPALVLGPTIVAGSKSVCSQTYLCVAPFATKAEAESFQSYAKTRFFRFLVSQRKISQDVLRSTYTWVPQQTWDRIWTDEELYKKYGVTKKEATYIESMIREMAA
jgi:site-specific DNA-methyltransferase (adenine-specific)